jgi:hypothetical protein
MRFMGLVKRFHLFAALIVFAALALVFWIGNLLLGDYVISRVKEANLSQHWDLYTRFIYLATNYPVRSAIVVTCAFLIGSEFHLRAKTHPIWIALFGEGKAVSHDQGEQKTVDADAHGRNLPRDRPRVIPAEYAENKEKQTRPCGLFVKNPGYEAIEIYIPSVPVGLSGYMLTFHGRLAEIGDRDHRRFFETSLKHPTSATLGGKRLADVMRSGDVASLAFSILYQDLNRVGYKSKCSLELDAEEPCGVAVRYLEQEPLDASPKDLVITAEDPLIYLNAIDIRRDDFSSSTAFVIENRGGSVAHLIHIARGEMTFGYRKVRFAPKDNLAVGKPTEIFPLIDNTRFGLKNDIIPVLLEEINAKGSAEGTFVENLGFSFVITHQSFDRKEFEVSVDVNFKSIKYLFRTRHPEIARNDPEEVFQITHSGFRRLS